MKNLTENITVQSYGSSLMLFISGKTSQEAYEKWLDLFNFGAVGTTDSQPEKVDECILSCWTTEEKLMRYLVARWVHRLADSAPKKGVSGGVLPEARERAAADYASIKTESYRSVGGNYNEYSTGTITAEKEDLSLEDQILRHAFAS